MITLEKAQPSDFNGYYRLRCQQDNIAWTGYTTSPEREGLMKWFEAQLVSNTRTIRLLKDDGAVVGYIYEDLLPDGGAELGYGTDMERRGQGLGKEILRLFVEQMRKLQRSYIIAIVATNNVASQKCLEHNGFVCCGSYDMRDLPLISGLTTFEKWELKL